MMSDLKSSAWNVSTTWLMTIGMKSPISWLKCIPFQILFPNLLLSEALYEEPSFPEKTLAASIISKVPQFYLKLPPLS